jgi:cytochrome P450
MSTALNFLLLMLAMHENVQYRIMREINEVFGEEEEECRDLISTVDYEKLSALKYVEMAIKEALRLFSPATGIFLSFSFLTHTPPTLACLFRIL